MGQRVEARNELRIALDIAAKCGAVPLMEAARGELVAAGGKPHRERSTGRDALTPTELRVAQLAAQGMQNKEIAQALFVGLRTVETHLTHVYQKLDIGARYELADALQ